MTKPIIKGYTPEWGSVVGGLRTGQFSVVGTSDEIISQQIYASVSGTFTGTVYLERFIGGSWVIVDDFNSPEAVTFENPKALRMRLRCAILSGGVINYALEDVYVAPTARQGDPGPQGNPGPPGSARADQFESRAAIEASNISSVVEIIYTQGFAEPGDGGDWEYTRFSGTLEQYYSPITEAYVGRYNLGFVQSADGQWWRGVTKTGPLRPECFGAKADFLLLSGSDQWGNYFVNPSPTDNRGPISECIEFFTTNPGGTIRVGPPVCLGNGSYYCSGPLRPYRSYYMEGMGMSGGDTASRLVFPAGSMGIRLRSIGDGNRSNPSLRNLALVSLGFGGQTDKHGIDVKGPITIDNVLVNGFGGHGVNVEASVPNSDANWFYINRLFAWDNAVDGIYLHGSDANAGVTNACNFVANRRWGLNDESFLQNYHVGHHAASNGHFGLPRVGGAYRIYGAGAPGILLGCYAESDQEVSNFFGFHTIIGGLHAAGFSLWDGGNVQFGNRIFGGHNYISPADTIANGNRTWFSVGTRVNSHFNFGVGQPDGSTEEHRFLYTENIGHGFQYANQTTHPTDYSFVVTPQEGSWYRLPLILQNQALLPKGVYIGGSGDDTLGDINTGFDVLRRVEVNDSPTDSAYREHRLGDLGIATDGKSLGRLCTTAGVKTTAWVSGSFYAERDVIQTPSGRVYYLDRQPYDPDLWSAPPATVRATHTSGVQSYNEPNVVYDLWTGLPTAEPGVNATEHPTQGFYTWAVVDESLHPTINFSDRTQVPHWDDYPAVPAGVTLGDVHKIYPGTGDTGTWLRNPDNGKTYSCQAIPVRPTKIYDQTWTYPTSTIEPTHTSGYAEYREPNPSISGSEPSDQPGYYWQYLTSNITPAYSRVGAVFLEGSTTYDAPNIADGASDPSEITIPVTGAALGDFVISVSCDIDTQGLTFIGSRVQAANTVKTRLRNNTGTGAAVNLANTTYRARVEKHL